MCCCFSISSCSFFPLLLLTITRKEHISRLHSYVIPSPFCIPNPSWKFVGLLVKHTGVMSFKCWRSVVSALYQKMRTTRLFFILKKIFAKGMISTQTAAKSISLFKAYERLKSPSLFTVNFLLVTRSRYFRFWA